MLCEYPKEDNSAKRLAIMMSTLLTLLYKFARSNLLSEFTRVLLAASNPLDGHRGRPWRGGGGVGVGSLEAPPFGGPWLHGLFVEAQLRCCLREQRWLHHHPFSVLVCRLVFSR